jgi:hypothetical protein
MPLLAVAELAASRLRPAESTELKFGDIADLERSQPPF